MAKVLRASGARPPEIVEHLPIPLPTAGKHPRDVNIRSARTDQHLIADMEALRERLSIAVSDDPEGSIENWLLRTPDGRVRLRYALRDLDIILIDTQGAVGPLQDAGVLAARIAQPHLGRTREYRDRGGAR